MSCDFTRLMKHEVRISYFGDPDYEVGEIEIWAVPWHREEAQEEIIAKIHIEDHREYGKRSIDREYTLLTITHKPGVEIELKKSDEFT